MSEKKEQDFRYLKKLKKEEKDSESEYEFDEDENEEDENDYNDYYNIEDKGEEDEGEEENDVVMKDKTPKETSKTSFFRSVKMKEQSSESEYEDDEENINCFRNGSFSSIAGIPTTSFLPPSIKSTKKKLKLRKEEENKTYTNSLTKEYVKEVNLESIPKSFSLKESGFRSTNINFLNQMPNTIIPEKPIIQFNTGKNDAPIFQQQMNYINNYAKVQKRKRIEKIDEFRKMRKTLRGKVSVNSSRNRSKRRMDSKMIGLDWNDYKQMENMEKESSKKRKKKRFNKIFSEEIESQEPLKENESEIQKSDLEEKKNDSTEVQKNDSITSQEYQEQPLFKKINIIDARKSYKRKKPLRKNHFTIVKSTKDKIFISDNKNEKFEIVKPRDKNNVGNILSTKVSNIVKNRRPKRYSSRSGNFKIKNWTNEIIMQDKMEKRKREEIIPNESTKKKKKITPSERKIVHSEEFIEKMKKKSFLGKMKRCDYCNARIFENQKTGKNCWCCSNGKYITEAKKKLPKELQEIYEDKKFSKLSRKLNYLLSMSTMGCSPTKKIGGFGMYGNGAPSNVILHGKTYHAFFPLEEEPQRRGNGNFFHYIIVDRQCRNIEKDIKDKHVREMYLRIKGILEKINPLYKEFYDFYDKFLKDKTKEEQPENLYIVWKSLPKDKGGGEPTNKDEIAMIIDDENHQYKNLLTFPIKKETENSSTSTKANFVGTFKRLYETLQFPLFFPFGEGGWFLEKDDSSNKMHQYLSTGDFRFIEKKKDSTSRNKLSIRKYYRSTIYCNDIFTFAGRLLNEYILDGFSRIRARKYKNIVDRHKSQEYLYSYLTEDGEKRYQKGREYLQNGPTIKSKDFQHSIKYKKMKLQNSLELIYRFGSPSLFLTFTLNEKWKEIQDNLKPGQTATDRPDICTIVFKHKYNLLLELIKSGALFGVKPVYYISVIEFQKRGHPHCHILVRLKGKQPSSSDEINDLISAKVPLDDLELKEQVLRFQVHTHSKTYCGMDRNMRFSERDGQTCKTGFPKELCEKTFCDQKGFTHYERTTDLDTYVVPYNKTIMKIFDCHHNLEICNSRNPNYLFKYLHKERDRAKILIKKKKNKDKLTDFEEMILSDYICSSEGMWRINGFNLYDCSHCINYVTVNCDYDRSKCNSNEDLKKEKKRWIKRIKKEYVTQLERYLYRPKDKEFDKLSFTEYFEKYSLKSKKEELPKKFIQFINDGIDIKDIHGLFVDTLPKNRKMYVYKKQRGSEKSIFRISTLYPNSGELFFLRVLLLHTSCGIRSFDDLLYKYPEKKNSPDNVKYKTFCEACIGRNLFTDESEFTYTMKEAIEKKHTQSHLRNLFVILCQIEGCPAKRLFDKFLTHMVFDWELDNPNFNINDSSTIRNESYHRLLLCLKRKLKQNGRTMDDYGLPEINDPGTKVEHERKKYNQEEERRKYLENIKKCNSEQLIFIRKIIEHVINQKPLVAFLKAKAGRGKSFAIKTAAHYLRSCGIICVLTASTGVTAKLFDGGSTSHRGFGIPFNMEISDNVKCRLDNSRKNFLFHTGLMVWDEITQSHQKNIRGVSELLQNIEANASNMFGGKVFVISGDEHQTAPVVRNGCKYEEVKASFKSYKELCDNLNTFELITPIRDGDDLEYSKMCDLVGKNEYGLVEKHFDNRFTTIINEMDEETLKEEMMFKKMSVKEKEQYQQNQLNEISDEILLRMKELFGRLANFY